MKKTYKNVLISLVAVGMLAGCASKKVEYEGGQSTSTTSTTSSDRLDNIAGSEKAVEMPSDEIVVKDTAEELMAKSMKEGINMVQSTIDGKTVVLKSVHFAFDKFNLTEKMRDIATTNASTIDSTIASYDNLKIKLEGNCDEWGTDEYNYALGLKRAKTAKDALIADGIDANRITMISFGESNPVCTEKNVACWKMNRRVDYRLLP